MSEDTILIALTGEACTGKTEISEALVPPYLGGGPNLVLTKINFAAPLYEMASVKQKTEGDKTWDRIAYEIHRVLSEVFVSPTYGGPDYDELVDIVKHATGMELPDNEKPRHFLQWLGTDVCRQINADCFVNYMRRSIAKEKSLLRDKGLFKMLDKDGKILDEEKEFGVVIADLRFENEAQFVKSYERSLLIKLTADPEVRQERARERDGHDMEQTHNNHASEKSVDLIPRDLIDLVLDTSELTKEEQALAVVNLAKVKLDIEIPIHVEGE